MNEIEQLIKITTQHDRNRVHPRKRFAYGILMTKKDSKSPINFSKDRSIPGGWGIPDARTSPLHIVDKYRNDYIKKFDEEKHYAAVIPAMMQSVVVDIDYIEKDGRSYFFNTEELSDELRNDGILRIVDIMGRDSHYATIPSSKGVHLYFRYGGSFVRNSSDNNESLSRKQHKFILSSGCVVSCDIIYHSYVIVRDVKSLVESHINFHMNSKEIEENHFYAIFQPERVGVKKSSRSKKTYLSLHQGLSEDETIDEIERILSSVNVGERNETLRDMTWFLYSSGMFSKIVDEKIEDCVYEHFSSHPTFTVIEYKNLTKGLEDKIPGIKQDHFEKQTVVETPITAETLGEILSLYNISPCRIMDLNRKALDITDLSLYKNNNLLHDNTKNDSTYSINLHDRKYIRITDRIESIIRSSIEMNFCYYDSKTKTTKPLKYGKERFSDHLEYLTQNNVISFTDHLIDMADESISITDLDEFADSPQYTWTSLMQSLQDRPIVDQKRFHLSMEFLFNCIANRILHPGCEQSIAFVIKGLQGQGKSSLAKSWMPESFRKGVLYFEEKNPTSLMKLHDRMMSYRGKVIIEMPDPSRLEKDDADCLKTLINGVGHEGRDPYEKHPIYSIFRHTIIITHNKQIDNFIENTERRYHVIDLFNLNPLNPLDVHRTEEVGKRQVEFLEKYGMNILKRHLDLVRIGANPEFFKKHFKFLMGKDVRIDEEKFLDVYKKFYGE